MHVFLAVCTGAHLLEWHGSCSQVESDPCWRGWVSGTAGISGSRNPPGRGSPVPALAPAAFLHIHAPVDTTTPKASGAKWV